jgi:hypothetical protein
MHWIWEFTRAPRRERCSKDERRRARQRPAGSWSRRGLRYRGGRSFRELLARLATGCVAVGANCRRPRSLGAFGDVPCRSGTTKAPRRDRPPRRAPPDAVFIALFHHPDPRRPRRIGRRRPTQTRASTKVCRYALDFVGLSVEERSRAGHPSAGVVEVADEGAGRDHRIERGNGIVVERGVLGDRQ